MDALEKEGFMDCFVCGAEDAAAIVEVCGTLRVVCDECEELANFHGSLMESPPRKKEVFGDLFDEIGQQADMDDFCKTYTLQKWESRVAIPALIVKGWKTAPHFYTTESDSFGPLGRGIVCTKNGETVTFVYG
jgi:hypothetical protein